MPEDYSTVAGGVSSLIGSLLLQTLVTYEEENMTPLLKSFAVNICVCVLVCMGVYVDVGVSVSVSMSASASVSVSVSVSVCFVYVQE